MNCQTALSWRRSHWGEGKCPALKGSQKARGVHVDPFFSSPVERAASQSACDATAHGAWNEFLAPGTSFSGLGHELSLASSALTATNGIHVTMAHHFNRHRLPSSLDSHKRRTALPCVLLGVSKKSRAPARVPDVLESASGADNLSQPSDASAHSLLQIEEDAHCYNLG